MTCDGNSTKSRGTFVPDSDEYVVLASMPCRAWPNSWNRVPTSSALSRAGVSAVGFLVAMFMLPATWRWILAGFVIYRVFDIWKPFPIGWIEDKLGTGASIMADDVIAGLYTLAILHAARAVLERLAGQGVG